MSGKTRDDIAHEEATRDPIFLFQMRKVQPNMDCTAEYSEDFESLVHPDNGESMDDYDLVDCGWATISWDTIGVFTTREEGEKFGEVTSYRYGSRGKGVDWKVYCIALERDSELLKILKDYYDGKILAVA